MSEDLQALIDEAVKKALAGDDDAINGIEDRVTRSKAKAALVKAKREQSKSVDENSVSESSNCLLYTSPSPRDQRGSRMPSSA